VLVQLVGTVLLVIVFTASACSSSGSSRSDDGAGAANPSPSAAAPDCSNQASVVSDPQALQPGSSRGDVDGDGTDDAVSLAADAGAPAGCRAFVVVETASAMLAEEIADPELSLDLGFPAVEAIAAVDQVPGDEIIVRIAAGASTLFTGLFTVHEGVLARVRVSGSSANGNLFPTGGSVGHIEGTDCEGDRVVVSVALPSLKRYGLTRAFYRFEDAKLVPTGSEEHSVGASSLNQYPEFTGPPFAHCGR
jgi:hypothetical protein